MSIVEGHPIPQDISGFQFRLVGDMTVKQFGYLGVGAIIAWIAFSAVPGPFLVKGFVTAGFALLAVSLAFLPIQGRPADAMLMLFVKALFKPNQFAFKTQVVPTQNQTEQTTLHTTTPTPAQAEPAQTPNLTPVQQPEPTPAPLPQEPVKTPEKPVEPTSAPKPQPELPQPEPVVPQIPSIPPQAPLPSEPLAQPTTVANTNQKATSAPFMPADIPNLIGGVVKDPRGNILPNILVEVRDKDANPVRAFKTNLLGQFTSATPLSNGTYSVHLEDPKKRTQIHSP